METCSVALTFEFVYEVLQCDHSIENSSEVVLRHKSTRSLKNNWKFLPCHVLNSIVSILSLL